MGERLAGPDPDPRHVDAAASLRQRRRQMVLVAHRRAAGGDDQVEFFRPAREKIRDRAALVGQHAEIDELQRGPLQRRGQHRPVGVEDVARRQGVARPRQLVAGGGQRHPQAPQGGQAREADSGGEPDVARVEHRAPGDQQRARRHVLSGVADVVARRRGFRQRDRAIRDNDVFLHRDGVRARWQGRASENADGFARTKRRSLRRAGGDTANQTIARRAGRQRQRVAVHRRMVEHRQGAGAGEVARQNPAARPRQGDLFDALDACGAGETRGAGLGDGKPRARERHPETITSPAARRCRCANPPASSSGRSGPRPRRRGRRGTW